MFRPSVFAAVCFAAISSAQLIPTTLPACAQQCTVLIGAQNSCASNPAAEASCFCQNADLAPIRTAPSNNLCSAWCSPTDWQTIANWYNTQQCPNGVPGSTLATMVATSSAAPGASSSAAAGTSAAGAGNAASSAAGSAATAGAAETGSSSSSSSSQTNASDYSNGQEW